MDNLWYEAASSIGIAVTGNQDQFIIPEDAIVLLAINFDFKKSRKDFGLMKLWLAHYAKYLRVDLLKSRVKELALSDKELTVIGALVSFCYEVDGIRWKSLFEDIKNSCKGFNLQTAPKEVLDSRGRDSNFMHFGVEISKIAIADQKKLMNSKFIMTNNKWMIYRKLLGPIIRADFLTAFQYSLVDNPFQAKQVLGCSQASSYRNWNELDSAASYGLLTKKSVEKKELQLFHDVVCYLKSMKHSLISKAS